ncbi:MAG: hypothetical protein IKT57_08310 [Clostridia bacterium]|nr:hypothetical protein [Clostridia bacterium]
MTNFEPVVNLRSENIDSRQRLQFHFPQHPCRRKFQLLHHINDQRTAALPTLVRTVNLSVFSTLSHRFFTR